MHVGMSPHHIAPTGNRTRNNIETREMRLFGQIRPIGAEISVMNFYSIPRTFLYHRYATSLLYFPTLNPTVTPTPKPSALLY